MPKVGLEKLFSLKSLQIILEGTGGFTEVNIT